MIKAILLDRDGTINVDKGYVHKIRDFEFLPGAIRALRSLYKGGFNLFVATNQSGIALGYYTLMDLLEVNMYMYDELAKNSIYIDSIVYCPHHPSVSKCDCRKPATGMLESLISKFGIDVRQSYMVGDKASDVEAGKKVGLTTIRIGSDQDFADYCCSSLLEASQIILGVKS